MAEPTSTPVDLDDRAAAANEDPVENLWIQRFLEPGATRLLCLPHAGGSAGYFFPLARALGPDVEVLAVQYPGRQNRRHEPFATDVAELVRGVRAALPETGAGSSALFGHSMGAVVAFELARARERCGEKPVRHLFVSGRRGPSCVRDGAVHALPDRDLIEVVAGNGGTSRILLDDPELRTLFLPVIRSDYRLIESYHFRPGPPLTCPITVLCGDADPAVTDEEAAAWQQHTTGRFDLRVFTGGHFFLENHRPEIAALLRSELTGPKAG
jgi:surfactin synthase thioesterase subunit